MFGFNFFQSKKDQPPANRGEQIRGEQIPDAAPDYLAARAAGTCGPIVDRVLEGLEEAKHKFVRFTPRDSTSAATFIASLMPGDVIVAGDKSLLVLGRDGKDGAERLRMIVKNRCDAISEESIKPSKLNLSVIEEVISSREQSSDLLKGRPSSDALQIASTLLGAGRVGSEFRSLVVASNRTIRANVSPQDGRILSITTELEPVQGSAPVVMALSSTFDSQRDFIVRMLPDDEISDSAQRNLAVAMLIVNAFENAGRLRMLEQISGF